ncbi:1-phosphatidylinositol 4,5-bisphosphate phosphodiesterase gamma-1 [Orchesella cincta]|uniref:Phosphoinositide phospholipase C n=1 Tax=Orchesella cincta TaxID=48709 RepID=A0A1D2MQY2_ORCCI|nr:1-phosphatidylinositol 4,5-bisphosphate phosphodiesterase gamma-1 [Orchesella cincta]
MGLEKKEAKQRKLSVCGQDVMKVAKAVINDSKVFNTVFNGHIRDAKLFQPDFHEFLMETQKEDETNILHFKHLFTRNEENGIAYMTPSEAENFLFSDENELCKPECSAVYQDMTRPLSHYWIASSHNTYLTGDQFKSDSSPDAYARCLQQGCRCLEIDCWNNPEPDGSPLIYHGYTMTSKIYLKDVLQTIKKYAFVKSAYPIILSIENHCSIQQQKVMAQMLQETFQDSLVSHPCKDNETELPSPEDLKYKILIKCKAINNEDLNGTISNGFSGPDSDLQFSCIQTRKRGILHCRNPRNGCWEPYKCILTDEKLIFIKLEGDKIRSLSSHNISLNTYPSTPSNDWRRGARKPVKVHRRSSFTEEWAPVNFADFNLISSGFSGNLPTPDRYCLELEYSACCAEIERNNGHEDLPHLIRITNRQTLIDTATAKIEEANEWKQGINEVARSRPRSCETASNRRRDKISDDLARLAVYARTTKFRLISSDKAKARTFNEMHSLPEKVALKTMTSNPSQFIMYHQVQFGRVYPTGTRLYSSNYDPTPLWNLGCQMVALNYQTPDKPLQLNHGKFQDNGGCGYVLKPSYLLLKDFNPNAMMDYIKFGNPKMNFTITVIAARHLESTRKAAAANPFVDIELFGAKCDNDSFALVKHRTSCANNLFNEVVLFINNTLGVLLLISGKNRLNPFWNKSFSFRVAAPELALIRFSVQNERLVGDPIFMGQATYPILSLRPGVRSINLRNGFGEDLMAVLLVKCERRTCDFI